MPERFFTLEELILARRRLVGGFVFPVLVLLLLVVCAAPTQRIRHADDGGGDAFGASGWIAFRYLDPVGKAVEERSLRVRFYRQQIGWPLPLASQNTRTPFVAATTRQPPGSPGGATTPADVPDTFDPAWAWVTAAPGPGWRRTGVASSGSGFSGSDQDRLRALPGPMRPQPRGLLSLVLFAVVAGVSLVWRTRLTRFVPPGRKQLALRAAGFAVWPALLLGFVAVSVWKSTGSYEPDTLIVPGLVALTGTVYAACVGAVAAELTWASHRAPG